MFCELRFGGRIALRFQECAIAWRNRVGFQDRDELLFARADTDVVCLQTLVKVVLSHFGVKLGLYNV